MQPLKELSKNHQTELTNTLMKLMIARDSQFRTAIDIGAHQGIVANRLSLWFQKVYAFEPHPDNFAKLIKEARHNIMIYNMALGHRKETAALECHGKNTGTFHLVPGEGTRVNTLDNVADEELITDVDLIKIDVEGFEYYVLQGAETLIRANRPVIVLEDNICRDFYFIKEGVLEETMDKQFGYQLVKRINKDMIFIPKPEVPF